MNGEGSILFILDDHEIENCPQDRPAQYDQNPNGLDR